MANYIKGIDVSSVQGKVDYVAEAATGIQFVIAKCGNGNDGFDPDYSLNITNATAAGLYTACYNFVYPLPPNPNLPSRNPAVQAQMHFTAAGNVPVHTIDIEWPAPGPDWQKWNVSASSINDWCLAYLETYTSLLGKKPLIYTYPFFASAVKFTSDFAQYPLWIASYEPTPAIPSPWTSWVLWQTTGGGGKLTNGAPVDTDVALDLSLWNVAPAAVSAPAIPSITTPPVVVPAPVVAPPVQPAPTVVSTVVADVEKPGFFAKLWKGFESFMLEVFARR
jgi:lysozyme